MEPPARQLVGTAWVAKRTGLSTRTVQDAAKAGRLPAYRVLEEWRFDRDEIEAWLAARRNQQATEPTRVQAEPSRSAPKADHQGRGAKPAHPGASNSPPLVVLFKNAAHRGINDLPSEQTARPAGRRGARQRKAAVPR